MGMVRGQLSAGRGELSSGSAPPDPGFALSASDLQENKCLWLWFQLACGASLPQLGGETGLDASDPHQWPPESFWGCTDVVSTTESVRVVGLLPGSLSAVNTQLFPLLSLLSLGHSFRQSP